MNATLVTTASTQEKLLRARTASSTLALLSTDEKNSLLHAIADAIEARENDILAANRQDIENSGLEGAMRERLTLTPARVKDIAAGSQRRRGSARSDRRNAGGVDEIQRTAHPQNCACLLASSASSTSRVRT